MNIEHAKRIIPEKELVKKLPVFLQTRDGKRLTEQELDLLIEKIWIAEAKRKLQQERLERIRSGARHDE